LLPFLLFDLADLYGESPPLLKEYYLPSVSSRSLAVLSSRGALFAEYRRILIYSDTTRCCLDDHGVVIPIQ
jgi:hypothetical protein